MSVVTTSKEINSSPEQVRQVLLDFEKLPEWTQGFIRSIRPAVQKDTIEKGEGDKLHITLESATFSPVVLLYWRTHLNKWRGSSPFLFHGDHTFRFDSGPTPGTTTFTHSEEFSGPLAILIKVIPQGTKQKDGFDGLNSDLQMRVEGEGQN